MLEVNHTPDLIEKFLARELADDEKTLFTDRFENDPGFAQEVRDHVDTILILKASEAVIAPDQKIVPSLRMMFLSSAAVLLMLVTGALYLMKYVPDNQALAISYFESDLPYNLGDQTRGASVQVSDQELLFEQARIAYRANDLQAATASVVQLVEAAPAVAEYQYMLGDLYFLTDQLSESVAVYQQLVALDAADMTARLKLAHAYLAEGQKAAAVEQLERVMASGEGPDALKARELHAKVTSFRAIVHPGNWW